MRMGDVLNFVEIEVAAILSRSQDGVGFQGGRRHGEDWQEHSRGANCRETVAPAARRIFREALWDTVVVSGFEFAREQLEAERGALCGPRYAHVAERAAMRAGHAKSSLTLGGRRAEIDRPRARSRDGHELALPERLRAQVNSTMSQAYAIGDVKRARQLLEKLARSLERNHPSAAAGLREGLDETLTVMRLDLPESLERVLSSTNLIENLFSRVREMARRVRHWQSGTMILRWSAAGMLEAERSFRKIAGYRSLAKLDAALRAHDAALDRGVDNRSKAA
jgi:Transposase, Mutator family